MIPAAYNALMPAACTLDSSTSDNFGSSGSGSGPGSGDDPPPPPPPLDGGGPDGGFAGGAGNVWKYRNLALLKPLSNDTSKS